MWKQYSVCLMLSAALMGCEAIPPNWDRLPPEFQQNETNGGQSSIVRGSLFGVAIGQTQEEAHTIILKNYPQFHFIQSYCSKFGDRVPIGQTQKKYSIGQCPNLEQHDDYHCAGLKTANIDVIMIDGIVVRIEWDWGLGYLG